MNPSWSRSLQERNWRNINIIKACFILTVSYYQHRPIAIFAMQCSNLESRLASANGDICDVLANLKFPLKYLSPGSPRCPSQPPPSCLRICFSHIQKKRVKYLSIILSKENLIIIYTESYSKSSYSAKSSLPSPSWSKSAIVSLIKMSPIWSAC